MDSNHRFGVRARAMTVSPQGNQRHWHTSGSRPQGSSYAGPDLGLISQQDPAVGGFCAPVVSRVCDLLLSGSANVRKGGLSLGSAPNVSKLYSDLPQSGPAPVIINTWR